MNVLSLFDGMSCGQQALERAGFEVNNYYASEIDKYGIKVTMANYPNTIQLGSVVDVDGYKLPKIDLLIGGSPCQSFSFAGKRKGMSTKDEQEILTLDHYLQLKSEGFEFEGQSYLFWEFMRLLNEVKPKYFLLENVEMGEKWEKVLSKAIGVNGIHINSALVSAQNRRRIYWTNIGLEPGGLFGDLESIIEQPKDRGILLKDILQDNPNAKVYLSDKMINYINKTGTKNFYYKPEFANLKGKSKPITMVHDKRAGTTNYIVESQVDEKYFLSDKAMKLLGDKLINKSVSNKKSMTIDGSYYKGVGIRCGDCRQIVDDKYYLSENAINYINRDKRNLAFQMNENDDKSGCITAVFHKQIPYNQIIVNKEFPKIRRLTPIECERLQTVADNYTNHVSDSQRYKMLGNGWTVDVIAHIFKYIK